MLSKQIQWHSKSRMLLCTATNIDNTKPSSTVILAQALWGIQELISAEQHEQYTMSVKVTNPKNPKVLSYLQLSLMISTAESVQWHFERLPHWI